MRDYLLKQSLNAVALMIGVTLLSFSLLVYFGPDQTYSLLGKNPTPEQIASVHQQLGYDQNFAERYLDFLKRMLVLDLGYAQSSGEAVSSLLARTSMISLALLLPGFVLGHALALLLSMLSAQYQGRWPDRLISMASMVSMSTSTVVVIIALQWWLSSSGDSGWFPVRGWSTDSVIDYLRHIAMPTLALVLVSVGYHIRIYRAVICEEMGQDYVRTARAFGAGPVVVLFRHVLPNCLLPIITRVVFSVPLLLVSGSLLLESYFGIPGIGKVSFDAITNGDQPVLLAIVTFSGVALVLVQNLADALYRWVDPRLRVQT
ncbi:MAG: ABC transporter permease [Lysobacteraceae bacterium]|nr:MAG: ABC transporter permease [Xanthomonadaceae bacterium]